MLRSTSRRTDGRLGGSLELSPAATLSLLCLLGAHVALSQVPEASVKASTLPATVTRVTVPGGRQPVESEVAVTAMFPDGDYRLFGAAIRCKIWTVGVEYDRHSFGYLLKSQFDYVATVVPIVLLSQPRDADIWGNPKSPYQQLVPGVSVLPIGFRLLWRSKQSIKPYLIGRLGAVVFARRAFSQTATYANFNAQGDLGVQIRLSKQVDLRLDPLVFYHVSNGYMAASNPGMDQFATRFGISYHLGRHRW